MYLFILFSPSYIILISIYSSVYLFQSKNIMEKKMEINKHQKYRKNIIAPFTEYY